jgi:hypothetical protein
MRQSRERRGDRGCHGARAVRSWQSRAGRESGSPGSTPPRARCGNYGISRRCPSLGSRPKQWPACGRSGKKLRPSTVATCRCCGCRGPEQHLDITPRPRPKIGEADADHQPVQRTPHGRRAHIGMARSTCPGMTRPRDVGGEQDEADRNQLLRASLRRGTGQPGSGEPPDDDDAGHALDAPVQAEIRAAQPTPAAIAALPSWSPWPALPSPSPMTERAPPSSQARCRSLSYRGCRGGRRDRHLGSAGQPCRLAAADGRCCYGVRRGAHRSRRSRRGDCPGLGHRCGVPVRACKRREC